MSSKQMLCAFVDDNGERNSFFEKCFYLKAGDEILLEIINKYSSDEPKEFTLEIKEINAVSVTTSEEKSDTLEPAEEIYIEYTAEKEAHYTFVTSGTISGDIICKYANKDGIFKNYDKGDYIFFDMKMGEKLLFCLENASKNALQYTFEIKELSTEKLPETTEETKYTIPSESNECYLEYTAKEDGIYTFTINGENISSYYIDENGSTYISFRERTFRLELGCQIHIKVQAFGSSDSSEFTVQIKKENPDSFTSLTIDEEKSLEFTRKSQVEWFSMQIPKDGNYKISGSNNDGASFYIDQLRDIVNALNNCVICS